MGRVCCLCAAFAVVVIASLTVAGTDAIVKKTTMRIASVIDSNGRQTSVAFQNGWGLILKAVDIPMIVGIVGDSLHI